MIYETEIDKIKGEKDKSRNIVGDFNTLDQHLKENQIKRINTDIEEL